MKALDPSLDYKEFFMSKERAHKLGVSVRSTFVNFSN